MRELDLSNVDKSKQGVPFASQLYRTIPPLAAGNTEGVSDLRARTASIAGGDASSARRNASSESCDASERSIMPVAAAHRTPRSVKTLKQQGPVQVLKQQ